MCRFSEAVKNEYRQLFLEVLDYIDDHYMEDLTLEDIAASTGFSMYHFSRLFKQYTNMNFKDYLCQKRTHAATILLLNSDLSVTEIAFEVGFSSISSFYRSFNQQENCAPGEYREHNKYTLFTNYSSL